MEPIAGRFAGQTVIVTGAGAGIGRATASRLLAEGARVVATDIEEERLASLAEERGAGSVVTLAGDISREATVQDVVAACAGRVDALANVAGIMDGFLPAAEIDDGTWDRVLAVNLTAVMRLTRAVLPAMLVAGRGSIVNVASIAALRGSVAGVAYTASKHALLGLTRSTAFIYGPDGIRTNAVAPGAVQTSIAATPRSESAWARMEPVMQANAPPSADAASLAANILWLMSDDARNINGAVLSSDGGWSAC